MMQDDQNHLGKALVERVYQVADDASRIGRALALKAEGANRRRTFVRSINVVVGSFAAIVSLAPPVSQAIGSIGVRAVAVSASLILILDGLIPVFFGEESYERLRDYSMYIHAYANTLLNTLADDSMKASLKSARLMETLQLATRNLVDVRSKWPWVDDQCQIGHGASASEEQSVGRKPTPD